MVVDGTDGFWQRHTPELGLIGKGIGTDAGDRLSLPGFRHRLKGCIALGLFQNHAQSGLCKNQVIHSDTSSNRFFSASIVPLSPVPCHRNPKNSGRNTSYGKMQQKGFEKNGRIAYNRFKSNMSDEDCPRHCDRTQGRRSKPGGTSYSRGN